MGVELDHVRHKPFVQYLQNTGYGIRIAYFGVH